MGKKGNSGQFKKGCVPWNKGKKMSPETLEKLRPTLFKKGHKNYNEKPLYSERISKDGYIEIKISNMGMGRKDWKLKHIWLYEHYHNVKVDTSKECVFFLDQNKRNFDKENLILISRSILRIINSSGQGKSFKLTHNADVNKLIITRAQISKAIADRKRRQ